MTSITDHTPAPTTADRPHHATTMLRSLDREWARLRRDPTTLDRARRWVSLLDEPDRAALLADAIERSGDLDRLVSLTHRSDRGGRIACDGDPGGVADADELLGTLVIVASDDALAARTVLQRILPGVISQARRWHEPQRSINPVDVAVGAAWIAIADYDARSRPAHVAPALIADTMWIAFRRAARRRSSQEIPVPTDVLTNHPAVEPDLHPMVALAAMVRVAGRAGVERAHLDLVCELARSESQQQAAARLAVSTRTVRNRRDVAGSRIRAALGAEWSDWHDRVFAAA